MSRLSEHLRYRCWLVRNRNREVSRRILPAWSRRVLPAWTAQIRAKSGKSQLPALSLLPTQPMVGPKMLVTIAGVVTLIVVAANIVAVPNQGCTRTVAAAPSITAAISQFDTDSLPAAVAGLDQALAGTVRNESNMFAFALRLENYTAASVAVLQSAASPVC